MEETHWLERVWQLSDEYELLKGTLDARMSSALLSEGSLLILCNGRALFGFKTKSVFKKKPLFAFTLKADDLLGLFADDAPEASIPTFKNLVYLKTFLKNAENVKRGKKTKGETIQSLITKFKQKRHLLLVNDLLSLYCSENLKREWLFFKSFSAQEGERKVLMLVETNLEDWLVIGYDFDRGWLFKNRLSEVDGCLKESRIEGAAFAGPTFGEVVVIISSEKREMHAVVLRLSEETGKSVQKRQIPIPPLDCSLRVLGCAQAKLIVANDENLWSVGVGDSKKMLGPKSPPESDRLQSLLVKEALAELGRPFFRPVQVEVQDPHLLVLLPDRLLSFDSQKRQFFDLFVSPGSVFRKVVVKPSGFYLLDRTRIVWLKADRSIALSLESKELDVLVDFQVSENEFLIFVFGKKGELFGPKTDLVLHRNLSRVFERSLNCGLYEFLLFASNSFKILIKRSRNSKSNEGLEIAHNPFFDLIQRVPEAQELKLKAVFFWYSNNQAAFNRLKTRFFIRTSQDPERTEALLEGREAAACPVRGCGKNLAGFSPQWFQARCEAGHDACFSPDSGALLPRATGEARVCLKCEVVFSFLNKCPLCESKLA